MAAADSVVTAADQETHRSLGASLRFVLKIVSYLVAVYAGAVVMSKGLEREGLLSCGCPPDCWCHRRGLSLFRWTMPVGHGSGG